MVQDLNGFRNEFGMTNSSRLHSNSMQKNNLLTINEFAKLCRSTPRTLRLYEQLGLLKPIERDKWNKYRLYDPGQGRLFFRIKLLQSFQVPLKEIKKLVEAEVTEKYLDERVGKLKREIEEKQKELNFVKGFQDFYFKKNELSQLVKTKTIGPFTIFGKLIEKEHYHQITQDLIDVSIISKRLGFERTNKSLVLYLEPENYKPLGTKIEISEIIKSNAKLKEKKIPDGYFVKKFPKVKAYVYTYKGPYEFITLVYEKLHELKITKTLPVSFQPFDIQLNDILGDTLPYDLTTKICFPVKK